MDRNGTSSSLVTTTANAGVMSIILSVEDFVNNRNALPKNISARDKEVLVGWGFRFLGGNPNPKDALQPVEFATEWTIAITLRDFHFSLLNPKKKERATIYYKPSSTYSTGGMEVQYL